MNFLVLSAVLAVATAQHWPNCVSGRTAFVHLFEWRWDDIAEECERFLGPKGYCAVQISPPSEHRIITSPPYPWYQRYQPVSYRLDSRSGNRAQFINMVQRCNDVGVRIYADGVINHMTGGGTGRGSAGNSFNANSLSFPGVPFSSWDFNDCGKCGTSNCEIQDYNNPNQVRNCRLVGLRDLNLEKGYVQEKVAGFLNDMIDIGVAGFRLDAAKHMWPGDISNIVKRLKNLNTRWFPGGSRPFIFQEVIDLGGETIKGNEYFGNGKVTEFKYPKELGNIVRGGNQFRWTKNFGQGWGFYPDNNAVVFTDNHDNQRGHGAGGKTILTFWEPRKYKIGNAFMLAWPYGFPKVMSSYRWNRNFQNGRDRNDYIGPPSNNGNTNRVAINSDNTCGGGWVCEHRWRQIYNMVGFRNTAGSESVRNWWDNGNNQIAFSRGNKAFIAINNEGGYLDKRLQTGLPSGSYCDVISGSKEGSRCTGQTINVDGSGMASIKINGGSEDPVVAIHQGSKL